jgi:uncharacterized protein YegP (UPF0339 family)
MSKLWSGGCLPGVFLFLALAAPPHTAVAQENKDTKKAEPAGAAAIEIAEGKDGKFRFFVRDAEGKVLAMSSPSGFATAKDAQAAVDQLKAAVAKAKVSVAKPETKTKEK